MLNAKTHLSELVLAAERGEDFDAPLEDFGPRAIGLLHGRGGFRTCDLSRVKRALSH